MCMSCIYRREFLRTCVQRGQTACMDCIPIGALDRYCHYNAEHTLHSPWLKESPATSLPFTEQSGPQQHLTPPASKTTSHHFSHQRCASPTLQPIKKRHTKETTTWSTGTSTDQTQTHRHRQKKKRIPASQSEQISKRWRFKNKKGTKTRQQMMMTMT